MGFSPAVGILGEIKALYVSLEDPHRLALQVGG